LRLCPPPATCAAASTAREAGRDLELERLRDAIVSNGGNLARAARMLGIPRTTLASRAARLRLV
jgi:transcriptional regulator with GAF, ATPase, and Fis domain